MKRNFISLFLTIACSLILSGCFIPEKFKMEAKLKNDKSYSFKYEGTMAHAFYLRNIERLKKDDSYSAKVKKYDEEMIALSQKTLKDSKSDFKKMDYKGNGIFDVLITEEGIIDKKAVGFIIPIFITLPNGNIQFMPDKIVAPEQLNQVYALGIKPTGIVTLKTEGKVIEHNATKTPGLFSDTYEWEIGEGKPMPKAIISFK